MFFVDKKFCARVWAGDISSRNSRVWPENADFLSKSRTVRILSRTAVLRTHWPNIFLNSWRVAYNMLDPSAEHQYFDTSPPEELQAIPSCALSNWAQHQSWLWMTKVGASLAFIYSRDENLAPRSLCCNLNLKYFVFLGTDWLA